MEDIYFVTCILHHFLILERCIMFLYLQWLKTYTSEGSHCPQWMLYTSYSQPERSTCPFSHVCGGIFIDLSLINLRLLMDQKHNRRGPRSWFFCWSVMFAFCMISVSSTGKVKVPHAEGYCLATCKKYSYKRGFVFILAKKTKGEIVLLIVFSFSINVLKMCS